MAKIGMNKNTKSTLEGREVKVQAKTEQDLRALPEAVQNAAGGLAFNIADPSERLLYMVAAGYFNEVGFYDRKGGELGLTEADQALLDAAKEVASRTDGFASDLLKIAAFARKELNVRTAPQVLLAVAAHEAGTRALKGAPKAGQPVATPGSDKGPWPLHVDKMSLVRQYVPRICQRADEPRVAFAAYEALFGELDKKKGYVRAQKHPNAFLRGLMDKLAQTPPNLLLKYDTNDHPTFTDLLSVVDFRRKGRGDTWKSALWFYLMNRKLPNMVCEKCGALCLFDARKRPSDFDEVFCERIVSGSKEKCGGHLWPFDAEEQLPEIAARIKVLQRQEFDDETLRLAKLAGLTQENITSQWGSDARTWAYVAAITPYMNLLRNLRNILSTEPDEETIKTVARKLTDPKLIERNKQFPYRYWTALRALGFEGQFMGNRRIGNSFQGTTFGKSTKIGWEKSPYLDTVRNSLVDAMELQCAHVPNLAENDALDEHTAIVVDLSGSMNSHVSSDSEITCCEVAALFGAVAAKQCPRTLVVAFGERAQVRQALARDSVVSNMERVGRNGPEPQTYVGGNTNAHLVPQMLAQSGRKFRRLILLSDHQFWNDSYGSVVSFAGEWEKFLRTQPDCWLHAVNLEHNHNSSTPLDRFSKVNLVSGFSERIFDLMVAAERGQKVEEAPVEEVAVEADGVQKTQVDRKLPTLDEIRKWY